METNIKPTPKEIAQKFLSECKANLFTPVLVGPTVVRVVRRFAPGDTQAFCECDMMAGSVLDVIPQRGGSQWGTDGGSIGGHVAIQNGHFQMSASGCSKRVLKELAKLIL